jgi:hypothetical protein
VTEHLGQSVKPVEELLTMRPQPKQAIEDLAWIYALHTRVPLEARKLAHRGGTLGQPERSHCRLSHPPTAANAR